MCNLCSLGVMANATMNNSVISWHSIHPANRISSAVILRHYPVIQIVNILVICHTRTNIRQNSPLDSSPVVFYAVMIDAQRRPHCSGLYRFVRSDNARTMLSDFRLDSNVHPENTDRSTNQKSTKCVRVPSATRTITTLSSLFASFQSSICYAPKYLTVTRRYQLRALDVCTPNDLVHNVTIINSVMVEQQTDRPNRVTLGIVSHLSHILCLTVNVQHLRSGTNELTLFFQRIRANILRLGISPFHSKSARTDFRDRGGVFVVGGFRISSVGSRAQSHGTTTLNLSVKPCEIT